MAFQVAAVGKVLGAVSRIVGAGNRVVFDATERGGSYIQCVTTGHVTPLRTHNGVYYLDVWYNPVESKDFQGFQRQAR